MDAWRSNRYVTVRRRPVAVGQRARRGRGGTYWKVLSALIYVTFVFSSRGRRSSRKEQGNRYLHHSVPPRRSRRPRRPPARPTARPAPDSNVAATAILGNMPTGSKEQPDEFTRVLAEVIRTRMAYLGLNAADIARDTGISAPTLSRLFRAERIFDVSQVQKVAAVLKLPLSRLIAKAEDVASGKDIFQPLVTGQGDK